MTEGPYEQARLIVSKRICFIPTQYELLYEPSDKYPELKPVRLPFSLRQHIRERWWDRKERFALRLLGVDPDATDCPYCLHGKVLIDDD